MEGALAAPSAAPHSRPAGRRTAWPTACMRPSSRPRLRQEREKLQVAQEELRRQRGTSWRKSGRTRLRTAREARRELERRARVASGAELERGPGCPWGLRSTDCARASHVLGVLAAPPAAGSPSQTCRKLGLRAGGSRFPEIRAGRR